MITDVQRRKYAARRAAKRKADPAAAREQDHRHYLARKERDAPANRARVKAWRKANPGKRKSARHRNYLKHREEHIAKAVIRQQSFRAANLDFARARDAVNYAANGDKKRAYTREYTATHAAERRTYDEAHKEERRVRARNRRARKRAAEGKHTASDAKRIRRDQKDKCAYCRDLLNGGGHLDHIVAIASGGSNWPSNLQIAYAQSIGLLL
jgi:hypothetical protein